MMDDDDDGFQVTMTKPPASPPKKVPRVSAPRVAVAPRMTRSRAAVASVAVATAEQQDDGLGPELF